jgi:hypothetical protein
MMIVIIDEVNDCNKSLYINVTSSINTQDMMAFSVQNQVLVLSQCKSTHTNIVAASLLQK